MKKSLLWPGASQWRFYYHRMWGELSTTFSNVLKQPNGELLGAVNHNQLRTMTSEAVDPIDWSHPPLSWAVSPERLVHSIDQCNLSGNRTCNRSMRGNHLAYAATQGLVQQPSKKTHQHNRSAYFPELKKALKCAEGTIMGPKHCHAAFLKQHQKFTPTTIHHIML